MRTTCKNCAKLAKKIDELEEKVLQLKRVVKYHKSHPTLDKGLRGEKFILSLIKGKTLTGQNAASDIELKNGKKVEVKFSSLNKVGKTTTKRWTWARIYGGRKRREKDWDYLILVGEKDRYYYTYEEDNSPYVYFLLDRKAARRVIGESKSDMVNLTLSQNYHSSSQGKKLLDYKRTPKEIEALFKKLKLNSKDKKD